MPDDDLQILIDNEEDEETIIETQEDNIDSLIIDSEDKEILTNQESSSEEENNTEIDMAELPELKNENVQKNSDIAVIDNSNLKILVVNDRGGVGKSTVAQQIIAPYLFSVSGNKKVPYYSLESKDEGFTETNIIIPSYMEVKKETFDNLFISLFSRNESSIFDIGCEKTSETVLNSLVNTGLIYGVDLFVIPLTNGKKEANAVKKIYEFIKHHNVGAKFLFVLNKVRNGYTYEESCLHFIDFLGDRNFIADSTPGVIKDFATEDAANIIYLYEDNCINYSVREGLTVFEIAFTNIETTTTNLKQALSTGDVENIKLLSYRKKEFEKCKAFYFNCIEPSLQKLDTILSN